MTTPIEQMILDAKRLATRLKDKEAIADSLLNESEKVNNQLETMSRYANDVNVLNALARDRSNSDILISISNENPHIREVQAENRQLKASIEEHQRALELIMSKYRQHTQQAIMESRLDFERLAKANESANCTNIISSQAEKLQEAFAVMQAAIHDDDDSNQYVEQLTQLRTENKGLREILSIASQYQVLEREKKETATQTDSTP